MRDTLHESAMITANGVKELREENILHIETIGNLERDLGIATAELAMYKERLAEVQRQCDFYMRYSVELVTQLNTIQMVVADAMGKAKDSAYRPSMAAPTVEVETQPSESFPEFLTKEAEASNGRRF